MAMVWSVYIPNFLNSVLKTTAFLFALAALVLFSSNTVSAQNKFSKTYPATKNIRLQLTNRSGTITVRGWDRESVQISAVMEKPVANIIPQKPERNNPD